MRELKFSGGENESPQVTEPTDLSDLESAFLPVWNLIITIHKELTAGFQGDDI